MSLWTIEVDGTLIEGVYNITYKEDKTIEIDMQVGKTYPDLGGVKNYFITVYDKMYPVNPKPIKTIEFKGRLIHTWPMHDSYIFTVQVLDRE